VNALVEPTKVLRNANPDLYDFGRRPAEAKKSNERIAVIGLGYVGLPLAVRLASSYADVTGFDISSERVLDLTRGVDATREVGAATLMSSSLEVTADTAELGDVSFYIVAVPTPITDAKQPDFAPLDSACRAIAPHLRKGDIVVFESTVYPGATEEHCGKVLERYSGFRAGVDFSLGYSPERINPGDKENTIESIVKVVAGDTPEALDRIAAVYETVIDAGIHRAPSIKVAECSKVLENTQRDVNIALMNEVSQICDKVGIATEDVIDAASTKWNFMPFTPGLVGGHCIGVDPYYLASVAEQHGLRPELISASRRINDGMVDHVVDSAVRMLLQANVTVRDAKIAIYGVTFKENVPDTRNSKVVDVIAGLNELGFRPSVHDLHCSSADAQKLGLVVTEPDTANPVDLVILATPHNEYAQDESMLDRGAIFMDLRGAFFHAPKPKGTIYWSL